MRVIILITFALMSTAYGQDTLYYFKYDSTGLVGVRDNKGKIIVPAIFEEHAVNYDFKKPIPDETIEFTLLPKGEKADFSKVSVPWGAVYSRTGELLYHPFFEDNGTDYWWEGVRRYVENGKVGFVDKSGHKLTDANWGYASFFNYGYAKVYNGNLKKVYEKGGERWTLGWDGEVEKYLINKKGQRVQGYFVKKHPKDYLYQGMYYPYPFEYTAEEQALLDGLEKDSIGISFLFGSNWYKYIYKTLQMEITERPSVYQPYYVIQMYEGDEKSLIDSEQLYLDAETGEKFVENYNNERVRLKDAIINGLEEFVNSRREHILPETRKIAEQELERLKSQP